MWFVDISNQIILFKPGNQINYFESKINFNLYGSASAYFNKTLYVFGGGSVLGLVLLRNVGHNDFFKISVDDICRDGKCKAMCSPGTFVEGSRCEVCLSGTYAEGFDSSKCVECRPGTFLAALGSRSAKQCRPCPEGSFSNVSGSEICFRCPDDGYCPLGCVGPLKIVDLPKSESFQPDLYKQPDLEQSLLLYRILVSAPLAFLLLILLSFKSLRTKLIKFDLFSEKHSMKDRDHVVRKQTIIGSIFSFFFLISALILTCSTILNFFEANIQESKGLVPLIILNSEVPSYTSEKLSIQILFFSYGGDCDHNTKCLNSFEISLQNINCSNLSTKCLLSTSNTCSIIITCLKGVINTGGQVQLSLKERLSYSTSIKVNITTSSSIPNQISSITSVLKANQGLVFIGSVSSQFYFLATPSLFYSESDKWTDKQTGYHVSEQLIPVAGSQFNPDNLPAVSYLNVKIFVDLANNALITRRTLKLDFMLLVGALLGTASGLFAVTGFFMAVFEKQVDRFRERRKKDWGNNKSSQVQTVTICANSDE